MILKYQEYQDLTEYESSENEILSIDEAVVEKSLIEARRNLAPAAAATIVYMQSKKIESATKKIRAADTVEEKLDAVADALDRMNTKSNAIAALTYFLTRKK